MKYQSAIVYNVVSKISLDDKISEPILVSICNIHCMQPTTAKEM